MKEKLTNLLKTQKYLCITADVWSSRAQAYLGMTVHFINEQFQLESFVLAFRRLNKKQTHNYLTSEIRKVLGEFGISVQKITHIVTDGGSAFCKAFKVYGRSVDHLIDRSDVPVDDEDGEDGFMRNENGEHLYSNIIQFEPDEETGVLHLDLDLNDETLNNTFNETVDDFSEESDDFLSLENDVINDVELENETTTCRLPPHHRCVSHYINLIPGDFEKELSGRAKTALVAVFGKLQTIWVFPRRSILAKTISREFLGCNLKLPCETRWNSKYDAVKHVYDLKTKINPLVDKLKENIAKAVCLSKLTNDDWLVIAAYLKVMEPVAISLDKLQGEQNASRGYILPTIKTMRHKISAIDGGNCTTNFKETMLRVIERRFVNFFKMDEINTDVILASVTVPRFKVDFIERDSDAELARRMLINECLRTAPQLNSSSELEDGTRCDGDDYFLSFASRRTLRRSSNELSIEIEVDRYLNDERKQLTMLNDHPIIRNVYFKYNTTLASSGAVERLFSQSSLIFTPRRCRISSSNFEYALLYKYNHRLLNS